MNEITQILSSATAENDPSVAVKLLPLIYDELRKLAASKIAGEKPGITIQATSLVHEAYLRLVERQPDAKWDGKGHFFSAAAEAMRRILVDRARSKQRQKRGGNLAQKKLAEDSIAAPQMDEDLLELDEALGELVKEKPRVAELVKLRYFVGLTLKESAELLDVSINTADRDWAYARAWLYRRIRNQDTDA